MLISPAAISVAAGTLNTLRSGAGPLSRIPLGYGWALPAGVMSAHCSERAASASSSAAKSGTGGGVPWLRLVGPLTPDSVAPPPTVAAPQIDPLVNFRSLPTESARP